MGQIDGGLEVPEQQEPAHRHRHLLGVLRYSGGQVERNVVLASGTVGFQAAATAHVGIDRYLDGLAASTFPADQVNDGLATLEPDEPGSFRCYLKLCGHGVHSVQGLSVPRRVGVEIPAGNIAAQGGAEFIGAVHL